jgi:hypothetical protein
MVNQHFSLKLGTRRCFSIDPSQSRESDVRSPPKQQPIPFDSSRVAAGAPTVRILQHGLSLLGWGFRYSDFSLRLFLSFSLAAFL